MPGHLTQGTLRPTSWLANGVTIQNRAQFDLNAVANKKSQKGPVFMVMGNSSTSAINAAFANLGEEAIIAAWRNHLRVNYVAATGTISPAP